MGEALDTGLREGCGCAAGKEPPAQSHQVQLRLVDLAVAVGVEARVQLQVAHKHRKLLQVDRARVICIIPGALVQTRAQLNHRDIRHVAFAVLSKDDAAAKPRRWLCCAR